MINTTSVSLKSRNVCSLKHFCFMNSWNFMLSWVEHGNTFYNLGACFAASIAEKVQNMKQKYETCAKIHMFHSLYSFRVLNGITELMNVYCRRNNWRDICLCGKHERNTLSVCLFYGTYHYRRTGKSVVRPTNFRTICKNCPKF